MSPRPFTERPIGVSIGEPAGIGPDVILKAWQDVRDGVIDALPPFVLLCDIEHLKARAALLGLNPTLTPYDFTADNVESNDKQTLLVQPLKNTFSALPGKPENEDAHGVVEAIATGCELIKAEKTRALMTLPINKKSLYDAGFQHPGHTEYLGELAGQWPNVEQPVRPIMMLAGPELRAVPATIHIPLKDVPSSLTQAEIVETVRITHHDMVKRFGIQAPRIAVSGLNPHAGEDGAMGHEDSTIILPAINELKASGIDCFGPLPADTMFHAAARKTYDAAVCMYHDQALIPAKALAFDESVNVTLGLPFVRTSPDHGTAFDIAGTGKANTDSTIAALRLADTLTSTQ